MTASLSACSLSVEDSSVPAVDYNAQYIEEKIEIDDEYAKVIAEKLDELDFGKISSYKFKVANGKGSATISDKDKNKYVINIDNGDVADLSDSDGNVIMTLEDMTAVINGDDQEDTDNGVRGKFARSLGGGSEKDDDDSDVDGDRVDGDEIDGDDVDGDEVDTDKGYGDVSKASYLSEEAQAAMDSLDTDYNKINWGVQYSLGDIEGIIISIAPYSDGYSDYLLVGITNLYDMDITISGEAYPKGLSGEQVGKSSIYDVCIGPANTAIHKIYCSDVPTGEIHWEDVEVSEVEYSRSVYWEADWSLEKDESENYIVNYIIDCAETIRGSQNVSAVILDAAGNVLAANDDYIYDKVTEASGTVKTYEREFDRTPADIALFVNPYTYD